jgi:hypothetical protein
MNIGTFAAAVLPAVICAITAFPSTRAAAQKPHAKSDSELVANAMAAGPPAVSREATIITMDGDKMRTLRQGGGEYTCVPDDPGSPGNDPMCLDRNAMEWLQAWIDQGRAGGKTRARVHAARGIGRQQRRSFRDQATGRQEMGDDRSACDGRWNGGHAWRPSEDAGRAPQAFRHVGRHVL